MPAVKSRNKTDFAQTMNAATSYGKQVIEKKIEREQQKRIKEAEKQMRKAEREAKKQFTIGSCLQYLKVLVDTHVVNTCGLGVVIFKACEELGVTCETKQLPIPYTVMWTRRLSDTNMLEDGKVETVYKDVEENEVLAILPVTDFVNMVDSFKQRQRSSYSDGVTLVDYIGQMRTSLRDRELTIVVLGVEQYFKELKSHKKQKFKSAVQSTHPNVKTVSKACNPGADGVIVTRVDIEEAVTDALLHTNVSTMMIDSPDDVADYIKRFSKAVAERPAKKDRFDPIFSFHEEGAGGVKVDKNNVGLLKVWKQQLMQFKNASLDVAQSIIAEYPSPRILIEGYRKCSSEKEAIALLENIVVRRGAGVLETARRVGKELSRKIYIYFTSQDPDFVIK